jgi:large subunit ribosomal protein L30
MTDKKVRIKLLKGLAGTRSDQRATLVGLGLRRINQLVELTDTPAIRGMVNKVNHLVRIEE